MKAALPPPDFDKKGQERTDSILGNARKALTMSKHSHEGREFPASPVYYFGEAKLCCSNKHSPSLSAVKQKYISHPCYTPIEGHRGSVLLCPHARIWPTELTPSRTLSCIGGAHKGALEGLSLAAKGHVARLLN